eukprot:COSAG01_NODE_1153_length_11487_cov_98.298736_1_plen_62_part_10
MHMHTAVAAAIQKHAPSWPAASELFINVIGYLLMWASTRLATQHEMTSIQIKIGDAPNHRSR